MSAKKIKRNPPQLVVLGISDDRKARAARFDVKDGQEEPIRRAAAAMNMRCGIAKSERAIALASKLPQGRIFESGMGLIPLTRSTVYLSLSQWLTFDQTFSEIGVISGRGTTATPELVKAADTVWSALKVGSTVLAWSFDTDEPEEGFGWGAAVIVAISNAGEILELRWRDYEAKTFKIRRQLVGLLRPDIAA